MRLFANAPEMPPLRDMHRIIATYPTIQAKLFLLLETILMTELLCAQAAFIGTVAVDTWLTGLPKVYTYEDDFASIGEPGLGNFATAVLCPLESQARGFEHGHKKVLGVPRASEAKLQEMFKQDDDTLRET